MFEIVISVFQIISLFLSLIGTWFLLKSTPSNSNATIYLDGGKYMDNVYRKRQRLGFSLIFIGFIIQFFISFYGLFKVLNIFN